MTDLTAVSLFAGIEGLRRVEHANASCGIISGTVKHANAQRSLTRLLDYTERGLAMQAIQKCRSGGGRDA